MQVDHSSEDLRSRLGSLFLDNRERWVDLVAHCSATNPYPRSFLYAREELGQMVDGFTAVILEALGGEQQSIRAFYLETVISAVIAEGRDLSVILYTVVAWILRLVPEVTAALPASEREEATRWLSGFFASYIADLTRVGLTVKGLDDVSVRVR